MMEQAIVPAKLITDDLFKPIFGAAWTGVVFTILEGVPKGKRLAIFLLIVVIGVVILTRKRIAEEQEE